LEVAIVPDDGTRKKDDHAAAADLRGDWRAAQRDTVAAKTAASVAAQAVAAAAGAEEAAQETEEAAGVATEAATRAKLAAERAKKTAGQAVESALLMAITAEGDQARADQATSLAEAAETKARERFHADQKEGAPRKST
jgi:hypothetical protein